MPAIRFAFISFLVLWGGSVSAQESLSKEEPELNRRLKLALLTYHNTALYSTRTDFPIIVPSDINGDDFLEFSLQNVSTDDFALHADERFFDSTLSYYNTSNFEKMLSRNVEFTNPYELEGLEEHYKLFSRIYGNIQSPVLIRREILSHRHKKFKLAFLTYQVSFKGASGELCISINTTNRTKPSFWSMEFTSYDYNHVPFFRTIASLPFEYIKTKNLKALTRDASKMFFWTNDIEKGLKSLNCDSTQLFKSQLMFKSTFITKNVIGRPCIFAELIYDMPKEDRYLRLEFINENSKFKLYDLEFIDKKKE